MKQQPCLFGVRLTAGMGADLADQWKLLGMTNRFNSQVDIQLRPVKVIGRRKFDMQNLSDRNVSKPWKLSKRKKKLLILQQKPEAVLRDVGNFNEGSGYAKRCGCHFHAPEQGGVLH